MKPTYCILTRARETVVTDSNNWSKKRVKPQFKGCNMMFLIKQTATFGINYRPQFVRYILLVWKTHSIFTGRRKIALINLLQDNSATSEVIGSKMKVSKNLENMAQTISVMPTEHERRHDKTNKVTVRPAKIQVSLDIRPV